MDQVTKFLNDPLVAPLYGLLVIALVDMLLGVYRSIQAHAFDFQKLPGILDSTVLQKVIPLAALGVAAFFITDGTAKTALQAAYLAGTVAALASEVTAVIRKVTGSYTPTTLAQDKAITTSLRK
jgi:hypothetical protein